MSEHKRDPQREPLHAYDGDVLVDPFVRCYHCTQLVAVQFIRAHAGCNHCGNKRFTQVQGVNDEEMTALRANEYDFGIEGYQVPADFLDIFEAVGA